MLDQSSIEGWHEYLKDFKEEIYPKIFQPFGVSYDVALQLWDFNKMLDQLQKIHNDLAEPQEEWKK